MTILREPSRWQAGWAGSLGTGGQLPGVQSGQSLDFRSVEASSLCAECSLCTSGPAEWDLHFNKIPQVMWEHIKVWETHPGAALFMKEKLVFLLVPQLAGRLD